MATENLRALVNKLNAASRRALEAAAGLCLSRTNRHVEIEHWLIKLLEAADSDLPRIFRQYDVDSARVNRELTRALDRLKTGSDRQPTIAPEVIDWMRE